jgi:hypothetical protein
LPPSILLIANSVWVLASFGFIRGVAMLMLCASGGGLAGFGGLSLTVTGTDFVECMVRAALLDCPWLF